MRRQDIIKQSAAFTVLECRVTTEGALLLTAPEQTDGHVMENGRGWKSHVLAASDK